MISQYPKISVIVPVYNVEKYLPRCIESILAQTFTDFELLLIDDGSIDNSGKICDEFAMKDSRIKVFHKKNGGVSSARNVGLDNAKGDWITFSDSDDELFNNALKTYADIIQKYPNVDIICCGHSIYNRSGSTKNRICDKLLLIEDKEQILLECEIGSSYGFLWNKCFRTTIVKMCRFDENLSWCEDHIFTYEVVRFSRCVCFSPSIVYKYYYNDTESKGKGHGLSNKLLDYNMILKVAKIEYDTRFCLFKGNVHLLDIINDAYHSKMKLALYYAIISGNFCDAYNIYKKDINDKNIWLISKFIIKTYFRNYIYRVKRLIIKK